MKQLLYIVLILVTTGMMGCDSIKELIQGKNENQPPTLLVKVETYTPGIGTTQVINAQVYDPDADQEVTVDWQVTGGELSATHGLTVDWTAPNDTATVEITATAKDSKGAEVSKTVIMHVGNAAPVITSYKTSSLHVVSGNSITLNCSATDPEGGKLTYRFEALGGSGTMEQASDTVSTAVWISPPNIGQGELIDIVVQVADPLNFTSSDTIQVLVYTNYGSLWVVDGDHKTLTKYTSNGHKIFTSSQTLLSPVAVISSMDELGGCYVADQGADMVYKVDFNGNTLSTYENIPHVIDLALYNASQKLWTLSYSQGLITVVDQRTGVIEKTISGFVQPTQIDINQYSGDVWVLESGNNRIINFKVTDTFQSLGDTLASDSAFVYDTDFNGPTSLYIHHKSKTSVSQVYIADTFDNQIERFNLESGAFVRKTTISPLSASPQLLGVLTVNLVDMLLIINASGNMELIEIDNPVNKHSLSGNYQFAKPQVLKIDSLTGECWIGDNGTNQLIKIKINGDYSFTVLRKLDGFLSIRDMTINR